MRLETYVLLVDIYTYFRSYFHNSLDFVGTVPQPDPNQPKPEGRQVTPVKGEPLGVICNWPPALESALQRWGTTQAKCPCLTALDVTGKPVYTLTYGEFTFLLIVLHIFMGGVFILIFSSC